MSYATPLYYAAKTLADAPHTHDHHPRLEKQRRRRIRIILFPALRAERRRATVAAATSNSPR
jgi:hypothetical protein